jgi:hypothetical protein
VGRGIDLMALIDLLSKERGTILERWHQRVLETYPAETAGFLAQRSEPFANPVGATLSKELPVVYQALLGDADPAQTAQSLDELVRLRAVQNFSPSQAIGFIFTLKAILREVLGDALSPPGLLEEWLGVEARVDSLALSAFDAYAANRERICEIRINAMRKRTYILERVALGLHGGDQKDPGP